jgi:hypothetical protein
MYRVSHGSAQHFPVVATVDCGMTVGRMVTREAYVLTLSWLYTQKWLTPLFILPNEKPKSACKVLKPRLLNEELPSDNIVQYMYSASVLYYKGGHEYMSICGSRYCNA